MWSEIFYQYTTGQPQMKGRKATLLGDFSITAQALGISQTYTTYWAS